MENTRILSNVIDEMLLQIPPENERLIRRLKAIGRTSLFAAPEMQQSLWIECAGILNYEIPETNQDWQLKIKVIFNKEQTK